MSTLEIPLTKGKVAVIDECDAELIAGYSWHARIGKTTYAVAWIRGSQPKKKTSMHRVILNAPSDMEVDHKDGNGLNNTRENLRLANRQQQLHNTARRAANGSKFKGVYFDSTRSTHKKPWMAQIKSPEGTKRNLGRFATEREAAVAYNAAASLYFGEFARLNLINEKGQNNE